MRAPLRGEGPGWSSPASPTARSPLWRILALWRRRAGLLAAGLLASIATLAAGVTLMTASGGAIAAVLSGGLLAATVALRIAGPARVVLRYTERMVTHAATFRALADLRVWFFRGLSDRAAGGLGFRHAGDVLSRLVHDVEALDGLYIRIFLPLAGALFLLPVAAIAAGAVHLSAGIIAALGFATAAFVLPYGAFLTSRTAAEDLTRAGASLRVTTLDALHGLREVKAFGAEPRMRGLVAERETSLITLQRGVAQRTARANAAAFLCGQAAILAVLLVAGARPVLGVAAVFLLVAAFEPLAGLARAGVMAGTAEAAAARVLDVAEAAHPAPDPARPSALPRTAALRFEAVHFAWDDARPVFNGLTLDVPEFTRVAILGPSGAGKSSLAALALKVTLPQSGRVLLGGTDLADLRAADLRSRIAWLSQNTHLFADTIRANLLLGRPEAVEADLWDALDRAAVGDTIRALPEKLDAWLGEGGRNLSAGQGRRVALARTLLSHAPILILDEPCAGLDADSERDFLTTLFAQSGGKTIILITHRLTGAERLDRVWRISNGHAVAAAG